MRQDNLLREAQKVRAIIQQRKISVYDSPTNAESDDFFTEAYSGVLNYDPATRSLITP